MIDKNYLRPAWEIWVVGGWVLVAVVSAWVMVEQELPYGPFIYVLVLAVITGGRRLVSCISVWRGRASLTGKPIEWIDADVLHKKMEKKPGYVWLGWGFEWKRQHMQRLYDLELKELDKILLPKIFRRKNGPKKGNPLIHGVEANEHDIYFPIDEFEGHCFIPATTRAIKTRLLALLAAQSIRRTPKETVIIIDPKGDHALRELIERECKAAGREDDFVLFHPAFPSKSVRIDVLRNFNRITELASRIAALIPGESGNDPFSAFGWRIINGVAEGCVHGEHERPTLKTIRKYIEGGPDILVRNTIVNMLEKKGINWEEAIRPYLKKVSAREKPTSSTSDETMALVSYYKNEIQPNDNIGVVDTLLSIFEHDRQHMGKMIASLIPVLTMLTAGELEGLLSPDREDSNDNRPIIDGAKIVESGLVVYIGLDSLSDAVVGDAIGSIVLADIASHAGARFNQQIFEPKINMFIDECNQVANPPFIQILNKTGGAGFRVCFFTQTFSDFVAKLGNEDVARQVIGNANSTITGRVKDGKTQEYCIETFGRSILKQVQEQQSTSAVVGDREVTNFSGSYGSKTMETLSEIIPIEALGRLPNLEYFATFSGSKIIKGRIPLIKYK